MNNGESTTAILLFSLFYLALADLKKLLKYIQQQGSVGMNNDLWNSKAGVKVTHTHTFFLKNYQKNFKIWKFIVWINYFKLVDYKKSS